MSISQSAGARKAVGAKADSRRHEKVHLAQAETGGGRRVRGMDAGQSPAPYEIHGFGKTKIRNRWTGMAGAVIKIPRIFCGQFGSEV